MDISERINKHERKKQETNSAVSSPPPKPDPAQPVEYRFPSESVSQATQAMKSTDAIDPTKVELRPKDQLKGGVDWRSLDYDSAIKFNPSLSRSQYISGAAAYRKENDKPGFTDGELYTLLGGKDPFISAEQEQKNQKRMKAAGYVDAIGNVLANLVNYVRTTRGNPAMNLSSLSQNTARLDKLKAYHDSLGRQNFGVYMDMLEKQRAQEAAQAAAERKFQQEVLMENMKQNSPINRIRVEEGKEKILSERLGREKTKADMQYQILKGIAQQQENDAFRDRENAELGLIRARTNYYNKKDKKEPLKLRLKKGDAYSEEEYDINNDKDLLRMYEQGVLLGIYPEYKEMDENGNYTKVDLSKMDPDKLRNIILYNTYNYASPEDADYNKVEEYKRNAGKKQLGWGASSKSNNDNNDLDW